MLSIRPPLAHCGAEVSRRHHLPGYEHVALILLWVGDRALVGDHNVVLHVPVHEIQAEVGADGFPSWKALNQAVDGRGHPRELHMLFLRRREWQ